MNIIIIIKEFKVHQAFREALRYCIRVEVSSLGDKLCRYENESITYKCCICKSVQDVDDIIERLCLPGPGLLNGSRHPYVYLQGLDADDGRDIFQTISKFFTLDAFFRPDCCKLFWVDQFIQQEVLSRPEKN